MHLQHKNNHVFQTFSFLKSIEDMGESQDDIKYENKTSSFSKILQSFRLSHYQ